ncbi:TIR protein [Streptomyces sp. YS-3]|uniref:TIR protein n=1 Tax=Streptomyces sp. YS-3 TaxID=3381352 RepID=UPI003862B6B1
MHGELPAAVGEFTGRLPDLWRLHSALHVQEAPLVTGRTSAGPVQLRGMPGIGKTRLAREYALRFGAAFPGGVHWVRAIAPQPPQEPDGPCLYVVDDVPHGLSPRALTELTAPHPLVRTLLITRSRTYGGHGEHVDLEPLPEAAAAALAGASAIADAAAGHPGALGLLGRAVTAGKNPVALASRLYEPGRSLLDILAGDELTADHVRDAMTAPAEAQDVLRCALALSPLPVTAETVATVLTAADRLPRAVALRRASAGVAELHARGLLTSAPHHLHPVTAHSWLHHEGDSARAETLRRAVLSSLGATATRLDSPGLPIPGVRKESMPMTVSEAERMAAFDLQVELVSRIGVQRLPADSGSLREALTSLNSLFPFTRDTLRRYSVGLEPGTAPNVQSAADRLLNEVLRPFTTRWHPLLMAWEARRPPHLSPLDHERTWDHADAFRTDLNGLREPLRAVTASLAEISGAEFGISSEV